MFIKGGIAQADDPSPILHVVECAPYGDHKMIVEFSNGELREFDGKILAKGVYEPLQDKAVFDSATIDHGVVVWCNGEIDVSPEFLYDHGIPIQAQTEAI